MKKLVVDCSLAMDHPDQQTVVDMTPDEISAIQSVPDPVPEPPSDLEIRLAALEAKVGITQEDKAAAAESLTTIAEDDKGG